MRVKLLIENVSLASMDPARGGELGVVADAAIAIDAGRIAWLGPRAALPALDAAQRLDAHGGWLTPGLIDCHTHLVHAGNRAEEFAARCAGASYAEIAATGGGIRRTVAATRAADEATLLRGALARLDALRAEGVTTVEVKSGYGLDLDTELRMLRVARQLGQERPVTVRCTLLAAHAVPEAQPDGADGWIEFACRELLPAAARAGLADAVDVFCEGIAFSVAQCTRVFEAATALGLPVKAHAEQLSERGGARAAAAYGALSVDHLEYLDPADAPLLAARGCVAVLLPGAFYFLRETRLPPVQALRAAGVAMAVASDLNPGSSPMASLLLAMNQACVLFGLTVEEALAGVTAHAARALGLQERKGMLRTGMDADIVLWPVRSPAELCAGINLVRPERIWVGGRDVDIA
jgi:imidazolonepropionase